MDAVKIGKAIQFLRKRASYTQQDLAERLMVSDKAVSKWERGMGIPDISLLRKLSIVLDTDIDSLLEGSVAYHEQTWKGILYLNTEFYCAEIYDKPLFSCLLCYFMLAKIRDIIVLCTQEEKAWIEAHYGNGESLGISLTYQVIASDSSPSDNMKQAMELFLYNNIMLIYGCSLIFGVNFTRFLQRGLINNGKVTVLAVQQNDPQREIFFDNERQIIVDAQTDKRVRAQNHYCPLPIIFIPRGNASFLHQSFDTFSALVMRCAQESPAYVELMDKGFIWLDVQNRDALLEASMLVRLIQKNTGTLLYCPEEVAFRRGLIKKEELIRLAEKKENDEQRYLMQLCEVTASQ